MNGPLRKVSGFVAILMAALLLNLTYLAIFRADGLLADPRNRRVRDAEFAQNRGAILVGNQPIALTSPSDSSRFPFARSYPKGELYSSVTGWYSYDYAHSELERGYNEQLAGSASSQVWTRLMDIVTGRQPEGADVHTTINPAAQAAAVNALGGQQGAAIAINYETGEILALVSTPTYDPNQLSTLDLTAARENWAKLLDAKGDPLKNRAVREVFPPGSTFKVVTAAAALEAGMEPDAKLDSPTSLPLPNSSRTMGNSTNCGGETTTLVRALEHSCNTAFGSLGMQLGGDKLREMATRFGFNADTQLDLPSVNSRFPKELDQAQTALSAIGQYDVAATPLQMLMVVQAIANDGKMMRPHVVSRVTGRDLSVLEESKPTEIGKPVSQETARKLKQMMVSVVDNGTGRPARISGLTVGGKTGTAQSAPNRPPYAWFVGFAEEPKVAVVAFVQSADMERDDISGGRVAAPVFKAVVEALR